MEAITELRFKESKIGLIPNHWSAVDLGEVADVKRGAGSQYLSYVDSEDEKSIRLIRIGDFLGNKKKFIYYNEDVKRFLIQSGDILIAGTGATAGITFMVTPEFHNLVFSYNAPRIRVTEHCNNTFLYHFLKSELVLSQQHRLFTGNAQPFLDTKAIRGFRIALPPIKEQQKIAQILSQWDKAIETTQNLIVQLQLRKKGLMQELLSGKKRLAGFSEEWKKMSIGEVATQFTDKNKDDESIEVLSCTKYDGLVPSLEYFGRKVYGDDLSKYKIVPRNYFAYATNHIEEGSIGYQNIWDRGLVSPMYTVFKTNDSVDDSFFFRLLKTERMIYAYQSNMSGSIARRGGLRWNVFETLIIKIPSYNEQVAIANVFNKVDEEIDTASKHLESLKQQKKGLMQQLLTGKKRVKL